jgi:beta-galactosidase
MGPVIQLVNETTRKQEIAPMKPFHQNQILFHAFLLISIGLACRADAGRSVFPLDAGWRFHQGDAAGAEKPGFDTSEWQTVDVPHDWSIAGPFKEDAPTTGSGGWLPSGVAWYSRTIPLPDDAKGKRIWVEFDGVMANSDVWMNGKHLGHRPNGYVSFRYDVSDVVKAGADNLLVVKSDTSAQPASRWYTGAGIYRHTRLVIVNPAHIAPWGIFVTTPEIGEDSATVQVQVALENTTSKTAKVAVRSSIEGPAGEIVATMASEVELPGKGRRDETQKTTVVQPKLWDLDAPYLYTLVTRVFAGERLLDEVRTPFGIRSAEFKSETGFWLNGKNLKIKGVCLHHDGGAVGAAVPLGVWERRLNLLRDLGVNAVRTAHNQPAPEFLDLCDRMGFLVMDEFFDCWTKGKNPHDYHLYFEEWSHTDLRDGILRDRNHPSIILYSVGNEIHDTPNGSLAKRILRGLVEVCHETDPSRPVTQALFRPNVSGDYDNGLADLLDVIGTNYRDRELLQAWEDKKGRKIIGTEQGHNRSTWLDCRDHPQHSGQFLWCGIDYLGESRSWPLTVFNAGLLDRAGFIQPRGRERQSWWSDKPMVAAFRREARTAETPADPGYEAVEWKRLQVLFPDWNPDSDDAHTENVEVYSNAEEVDLVLNGKSLGKKKTRADAGSLNWEVPYEPGTLEAIAYQSGKEVARDTLRTAGKPVRLRLVPDKASVAVGWDHVVHVEVQLVDENGTVVPNAADHVKFTVSGPGKMVAVDSGNVVSIEPFQASERRAYQGRCLAILRATGQGTIKLSASAEGMEGATVEVAGTVALAQAEHAVASPDGKLVAGFSLESDGVPHYRIRLNGKDAIASSRLGLVRDDADFSKELKLVGESSVEPVADDYGMLNAKRRNNQYRANRKVFNLEAQSGKKMDIVFQVSDDGVAFRYHFPETSDAVHTVNEESSSFQFLPGTKAWLQPMSIAKTGWAKTNPSYEEYYEQEIPVGTPSPLGVGWVFPALFRSGDTWLLVSEGSLSRGDCGSRLRHESPKGEYTIGYPDPRERFDDGPVNPTSTLPWTSPWRFVVIGDLKTVAESMLGVDLAAPAKFDPPTLPPGKASWSWPLLGDAKTVYDVQRAFVDYAAGMNWKYCLVDALWDTQIGYGKMKDLVDYAKKKGVEILVWYNSNGTWNDAHQTPRHMLLTREKRLAEFKRIKAMGIAGLKIDFFAGDGSSMIDYYIDILEDAQPFGFLINFHGCTLPRGWQRTYPNLMTMESVRGLEFITFDQANADKAPTHMAMLPFTRNVFDPMDFTPMALDRINDRITRRTTPAFELALSVLFTSGIQHYAEIPEGMDKMPDYVKQFLKQVPSVWDDVKFIDGYPGKHAVMARQGNGKWFVAGINGTDAAKPLDLDLSGFGSTSGTMIADGKESGFERRSVKLQSDDKLVIEIPPQGGFVLVLD